MYTEGGHTRMALWRRLPGRTSRNRRRSSSMLVLYPFSAAWQPSAMDTYTARSFASLTGDSMNPHASFLNNGSSRKASCPAYAEIKLLGCYQCEFLQFPKKYPKLDRQPSVKYVCKFMHLVHILVHVGPRTYLLCIQWLHMSMLAR